MVSESSEINPQLGYGSYTAIRPMLQYGLVVRWPSIGLSGHNGRNEGDPYIRTRSASSVIGPHNVNKQTEAMAPHLRMRDAATTTEVNLIWQPESG